MNFFSKVRIEILILFILNEVIFYGEVSYFQLVISIFIVIFLIIVFFVNNNVGVKYLLSFSILTLGEGNYSSNLVCYNFFNLRVLSISLQFFLFVFFLVYLMYKNKGKFLLIKNNELFKFFLTYGLIGIIIGIFNLLYGDTYFDNFTYDLKYFIIAIISVSLIWYVKEDNIEELVKMNILATSLMIFFSFILDKYFIYSVDKFLVQNSIYFIWPFLIFYFIKKVNPFFTIFNIILLIFILYNGLYLISGKVLVLVILFFFWIFFTKSNKFIKIVVLPFTFIFVPIFFLKLDLIEFTGNKIFLSKFGQIQFVFQNIVNFDFQMLLGSSSSITNIFTELYSIINKFINSFFLFFGYGFGAGVNDVTGFLSPLAGNGGYKEIDLYRNNFFKMHLPISEFFLKGGIIFAFKYLKLIFNLNKNGKYSFITFSLFFTVITFTKELFVLSILFYFLNYERKVLY